jgi:ABC-2 type transport system ATP-binding protein
MSPGLPSAPETVGAHDLAIAVDRVSKSFHLPHERRNTLKEYFLHPLRRADYEEQCALADVSFQVEPGGFLGIIGPNGSGKSTLLKIIAGIYRQDAGTVRLKGLLSPFIELGVGFHPELTARDNIWINGTLLGLDRQQLRTRYQDIIGFAELERFVDQKLKNYSSGMQVRLAYAIAIQVDFDILLLDEVLAVGDESFQQKCLATFERFREEGKTIVLVTHNLDHVNRFADQALLLLDGRIRSLGAPDDVIADYNAELASREAVHAPLAN